MDRRQFLLSLTAAPILLRVAPEAFAKRLGGTPVALVTADHESRLIAVNLSGGRAHSTIETLPGPRSIQSVGNGALVAHTTSGAVTLLDGPTLGVRRVLRDFDEPRYAVAAPDGRHVYVTDSARGEVVVVDVRAGRIVGRTAVGGPARHISIARNGRRLWVVLGSEAERIAVLDLESLTRPRLVRSLRPPFLAHDVGHEPGGRRVWVTAGDRGEITVYDLRSGRFVQLLPAGSPPQHVTFLGGAAHVTSGDDGTLRVYSLRTRRLLRTARIPLGSYNVQEGWGVVLTPSLAQGTLCVLDARGRLREQMRVASSSHDACFVMSA